MNDANAARDACLKKFAQSLARLTGADECHDPLVVDLDDLLRTMEEIATLLCSFADLGEKGERAELRWLVSKLSIVLESDLPMILEDVLPAMKRLLQEPLSKRDGELYERIRRREEEKIQRWLEDEGKNR